MRYREILPAPPLLPFVQAFWTLDSSDAHAAPPQRVVPDGHAELILNLAEPFEYCDDSGRWHRQPRLFFAGQIRGPLLLRDVPVLDPVDHVSSSRSSRLPTTTSPASPIATR